MSEEGTSETIELREQTYADLVRDCARARISIENLLAKAGISVKLMPDPKPMTQEQVESWIMLKGQNPDERWFEIRILDEEVGNDPTAQALMKTVSDMIFKGIAGMPFIESRNTPAPPRKILYER